MGKPPPVERHGLPKGMVRLRFDWIVPYKECFDFFCDFDASVSLNEGHDFALSVSVMPDISGCRAEACVSSQHLDIPQATANFADPSRCTGHERPPAALRGAADHPEPGIKAMEPHSDRARRQTPIAFAVDDRPIWMCPDASVSMESHERCLKVRVHRDHAPSASSL